MKDNTTACKW